jgi:hypothetical protein
MKYFVKKLYIFFILGLSIISSKQTSSQNYITDKKIEINYGLVEELKAMAKIDQIAAFIPQGKYKNWSIEKWNSFKDSVFTTHKIRLEEIFNQYGYPGYSLVGEKGEKNFWLMIQHCDSDPAFQSRVLEKLKIEVEKVNADVRHIGLLTDRVKINIGEKQVYGTQVTYNSMGQAYPKNLAASANVNNRRAEVRLEPIEEYLNKMTKMYFEMNKEKLKSIGITKPQLYEINN